MASRKLWIIAPPASARVVVDVSLPEGTEDDCVLRCVNPRCWRAIYSAEPLEPGEIDKKRATQFEA